MTQWRTGYTEEQLQIYQPHKPRKNPITKKTLKTRIPPKIILNFWLIRPNTQNHILNIEAGAIT